jgi:hypothetical protein
MRKLNSDQRGFITLIIALILILGFALALVYIRVLKAHH